MTEVLGDAGRRRGFVVWWMKRAFYWIVDEAGFLLDCDEAGFLLDRG